MSIFQSPQLNRPGVAHGFFGRQGGFSQGLFASLNCGLGSGDDLSIVQRNRAVVAEAMGGVEADIVTAFQVHSAEAVIVNEPLSGELRPKADGLVTNRPGLILGTLTADCGPILFADMQAHVIGAAHAGWKGALGGVTDATVIKMEDLGAKRQNITAVLGPMISQQAYEVGPEFLAQFVDVSLTNELYFKGAVKPGHHMFDLPRYLKDRLLSFGVGQVEDCGLCTYTLEERFFSYRRTTHRHEAAYGRQIAAISLSAA